MDPHPPLARFAVVQRTNGGRVHRSLKTQGWLASRIETVTVEPDHVGFPLTEAAEEERLEAVLGVPTRLLVQEAMHRDPVDPHARLQNAVSAWLSEHGMEAEGLLKHLPKKWERLGDLVLLPAGATSTPAWLGVRRHPDVQALWMAMASSLQATSLGIQNPIANDTYRSSQVEMLLGTPSVCFLDHGITYAFDASKVMFSSGNVTERRRIGGLDMTGETVIDAYAGVGYYTLPMLVHGNARHVHACEINPASITGLRNAAKLNGIEQRLTVHEGDNAETLQALKGVADRCHLGLLPSSEPVWAACLAALKPTGGVLHVHMNVEEEHLEAWKNGTVERFQHLAEIQGRRAVVTADHLEKVKWFAPRVRHVVLDVRVQPVP
jgi:tRNA G37 N-methylase Trm5